MPKTEVEGLLESLREDRSIWAVAQCGHDYRLADSVLFYGSDVPQAGKEYVRTLQEELRQLDRENKELLARLTAGFTKKSAEVKLGKTVEKVSQCSLAFHTIRGTVEESLIRLTTWRSSGYRPGVSLGLSLSM